MARTGKDGGLAYATGENIDAVGLNAPGCYAPHAHFIGNSLFDESFMPDSQFPYAKLHMSIRNSDLVNSNFSHSELKLKAEGANLSGCKFEGASGTITADATTQLTGADFSKAPDLHVVDADGRKIGAHVLADDFGVVGLPAIAIATSRAASLGLDMSGITSDDRSWSEKPMHEVISGPAVKTAAAEPTPEPAREAPPPDQGASTRLEWAQASEASLGNVKQIAGLPGGEGKSGGKDGSGIA